MKDETKNEVNVASSMAQAESLTGIPFYVIKRAKRSGCPAFNHQRIKLQELRQWLIVNPIELKGSRKASSTDKGMSQAKGVS